MNKYILAKPLNRSLGKAKGQPHGTEAAVVKV